MNEKVLKLLQKYNNELFKLGILPKRSEDYCGQPGLKSLHDEHAQLYHLKWMIDKMLDEAEDWSDRKVCRWLGFIQGILWCTKFRGILELRDESRDLYDGE